MIRMLRMLDMPLKEIQDVINENVSLKEAVEHQREVLQTRQKQLGAAIEVCTSISREKADRPDVDSYLLRMETMERNGGIFARFVDDYKQVVHEEQERSLRFMQIFRSIRQVHLKKSSENMLPIMAEIPSA